MCRMPTESLNGIEMYYEVHGPKNDKAEPLLFLHGGGGMGVDWTFLSRDWPFQMVAPDLPEHGRSTGCAGTARPAEDREGQSDRNQHGREHAAAHGDGRAGADRGDGDRQRNSVF